MGQQKQRLIELRQRTHFTSQDIATAANVSLGEAYAVEVGGFASQEVAQKVVAAFARLSGKAVTIHDIVLNTSVEARKPKEWGYE